jgi:hypothetical protein
LTWPELNVRCVKGSVKGEATSSSSWRSRIRRRAQCPATLRVTCTLCRGVRLGTWTHALARGMRRPVSSRSPLIHSMSMACGPTMILHDTTGPHGRNIAEHTSRALPLTTWGRCALRKRRCTLSTTSPPSGTRMHLSTPSRPWPRTSGRSTARARRGLFPTTPWGSGATLPRRRKSTTSCKRAKAGRSCGSTLGAR